MKWSALSLLPLFTSLVRAAPSVPDAPGWRFDLKNTTSGIVALESIVVSPTLVVFFDRASDDPLQINGHSAWGALWNLETSTVQPLDVLTNSICASGALLSNGTMASVGGNNQFFDGNPFIHPGGTRTIRILEPCASPTGEGCTLFENPDTFTLLADRYYPSSIRIFDGSLMIIGGANQAADFFNNQMPENSFEFFPSKEDAVRPSAFLARSEPANLFPRAFALPDGTVFMVANNQSIIYDIEKNTETILPDIPNNVRVTNPIDGSAILLPLSPPEFIPEVLVCGGSQADISDRSLLSSQTPATTQCSRITLTPEGIAKGWEVEHMLEPRMLPELVHIPNGQVLITNGAQTGFAGGTGSLQHPIGNSNADHPALTPSIYTPDAPLGQRISNEGMPTTNIARMYHSSVTLTPQGNFLVAGSNPNGQTVVGPNVTFPSEFRVETLDPPFMFVERPKILDIPDKVPFGQSITVPISLPSSLSNPNAKVQVALMDLGFSSHAFHSGARLVFMDATISSDSKSLTFVTPPNGRVYPPGPATVFLTVDNVTSEGAWVMVGSGNSPPTLE